MYVHNSHVQMTGPFQDFSIYHTFTDPKIAGAFTGHMV